MLVKINVQKGVSKVDSYMYLFRSEVVWGSVGGTGAMAKLVGII